MISRTAAARADACRPCLLPDPEGQTDLFQLDSRHALSLYGSFHVSGEEGELAAALVELAERTDTRWVAANEPRYLDADGRRVHDFLTALRENGVAVCGRGSVEPLTGNRSVRQPRRR